MQQREQMTKPMSFAISMLNNMYSGVNTRVKAQDQTKMCSKRSIVTLLTVLANGSARVRIAQITQELTIKSWIYKPGLESIWITIRA